MPTAMQGHCIALRVIPKHVSASLCTSASETGHGYHTTWCQRKAPVRAVPCMLCHAEANGACPAVQVQYNASWLLLKACAGHVLADSRPQNGHALPHMDRSAHNLCFPLVHRPKDELAGLHLVAVHIQKDPVSLSAKQVAEESTCPV